MLLHFLTFFFLSKRSVGSNCNDEIVANVYADISYTLDDQSNVSYTFLDECDLSNFSDHAITRMNLSTLIRYNLNSMLHLVLNEKFKMFTQINEEQSQLNTNASKDAVDNQTQTTTTTTTTATTEIDYLDNLWSYVNWTGNLSITYSTCVTTEELEHWRSFYTTKDWFNNAFLNLMKKSISIINEKNYYNYNLSYVNVIWTENIPCQNSTLFESILFYLEIAFGVLVGCGVAFAISVYIHSWVKWLDDMRIGNVINFILQMIYFFCQILFCFSINNCNVNESILIVLFWLYISIICLFSLIINVFLLVKYQTLWENDVAIGSRLNGWNRHYRSALFMLTLLCGSSYAAVTACNSNALGKDLARMGLSTTLHYRFYRAHLPLVFVQVK